MSAASGYERWLQADWVKHYAGPRFDPYRAEVGSLWDPLGRPMPLFQAGQSLAFTGFAMVGAREFPLGFFAKSVPPICTPATPASIVGTTDLSSPLLYGHTGSLAGTSFHYSVSGGPTLSFDAPLAGFTDEASFLASFSAFVSGTGVSVSADPITNVFDMVSLMTGSSTTITVSGTMPPVLGVPMMTYMGMDTSPGASAFPVISRSQLRHGFRGERLVIPSDIAANFSVLDVKVGNCTQMANVKRIPAETFIENAVGVRLSMDTAVTAMDIAIVVANLTSGPLPFRATIIGSTYL